jgi:hypothetical protein
MGRTITGKFDFVITMNNKLKIGTGHLHLSANSLFVQGAGSFYLKSGTLVEKTNGSGHY